ncbi:helix-turn-helix transcriptional regulator [Micromonospora sp. WMMD1102]|uniref:helix-turn-helix domain-containing protein n=1 Tax=Micromonospora sp. WMMD1102 TaxID=3016105 RepID=UPI0024154704|nr:helix-turn-helix transcriptional regulator [Micromonospora sp. WMMD1102]MDG4791186.1 helix-turn-helix transcriptional regulator [Micromonospora sp. WMMD1102]
MSNLPTRLKGLRAERGVTQDQVADAVQVSKSLIAAFETSRLSPKQDTAAALDAFFESGDEIQKLSTEARKNPTEARKNRRPTPSWFRPWRDLEETAVILRYFQATLIPGLLQTEAYARAVFASTGMLSDEEVAARVTSRMERQAAILDRADRPTFAFIIDAAAPRCGPAEIAKEQLQHLADTSSRPNIFVHVVPDTAGLHAGRSGSFALATMDGGGAVGLLDDFYEGRVVEEPSLVTGLERTWQTIAGVALPCDQSRTLILRLVNDYDDPAAELAQVQP